MILTQKCFFFSVFLAVLSDVGAIYVDIREDEHQALRGDTVTLTCNFQTKTTPTTVAVISWSAKGTQPTDQEALILTYYSPMKVTDIKSSYHGRVIHLADFSTGKAFLRLSSVTVEDDKIYECRVMIPGDDEGKPADTTRLVVNVAVSDPICGIQGTVRQGENVNLTCHSEEGSPPISYKWEKWHKMGFRRSFMEPTAVQNGGVLSLSDISNETSGQYVCISSNKIRTSTCHINLTVPAEAKPNSFLFGAVAGAVAGVVAGTVAGAAGVFAGAVETVVSTADKVILGNVNHDGGQTPSTSP